MAGISVTRMRSLRSVCEVLVLALRKNDGAELPSMSGLAIGRGKVLGATAAAAVVLATVASGGAAQAAPQDLSQLGLHQQTSATDRSSVVGEASPVLPPSVCTVASYAP